MAISSPTDISGLNLWLENGTDIYEDTGTDPAEDGDSVRQWNDQSGNGYHGGQATKKPFYVAADGAVHAASQQDHVLEVPASYPTNKQAFTIALLVDLMTAGRKEFNGSSFNNYRTLWTDAEACALFVDTTTSAKGVLSVVADNPAAVVNFAGAYPVSRLALYVATWSASEAAVYYNKTKFGGGDPHASGSTAGSSARSVLNEPVSAVSRQPAAGSILDVMGWNRALTSTEVEDLVDWCVAQRGLNIDTGGTFVVEGDSISSGADSSLYRSWTRQITLPVDVTPLNCAQPGYLLSDIETEGASVADVRRTVGGGTSVIVCWAGTNDITNAATDTGVLTDMAAYYSARKSAGWDHVIVATIMPRFDCTGSEETFRQNINNALTAASPGTYFDHLVDLTTVPELLDYDDTTYFVDKIHPTTAGATVIAAQYQAVLDTIWPPAASQPRRSFTLLGVG